ncbi:MAG: isocitrate/isopropylmalate dehydrogenase family protein [Desulfobacterales bacterium]|jgi:3-isopropylmalate dehydrogenase
MAQSYWITILPGDGIGPEIVEATLDILETVQELSGRFALIYEFHQAGAECYRETGQPITADALEAFERANATLKGPVGLPGVRKPDGTEAGLLGGALRVDFDLYANVRPIKLFPNVQTPLAMNAPGSIDYVILRENSEGLYLSRGVGLKTRDAATDCMMMTRRGCERISRYAFRLALEKHRGAPQDGVRRVTLVDKSNVLRSYAFFRDIFQRVSLDYPEVATECLYMDAAAAALVNRPGHFHVIVTENMFGDILSDLGGATIGGLGMCPAANIGDRLAYFEPIHGSAPDIAGKNLANPTSQILSAAMMLQHLGEPEAAVMLKKAVWDLYAQKRIPLMPAGTVEGGAATVAKELKTVLNEAADRS